MAERKKRKIFFLSLTVSEEDWEPTRQKLWERRQKATDIGRQKKFVDEPSITQERFVLSSFSEEE
ncbi:hypothetical protein RUM43_007660 [Polyplax serrata]|uniref:Uncharacterized protein n=1 Tax=Polyplax serrata TaxID=468196 RepID=A0AAN8PN34_POLSC